jgi:dCMP deaminase
MSEWDRRFLELGDLVASWSKDPSTKVGAVITDGHNSIISVGFNGFPRGMEDTPERLGDRDDKYSRTIHGEINALLHARGSLPEGCTLYTVPFMPCDRCVVQMLQGGIRRFVTRVATGERLERWGATFEKTRDYINECGGELIEYEG